MLDAERSFPLTYSRPTRNFTAGSPVDGAETADGLIIAIGFPGGPLRNPAARARNYTPIPDGETDDRVSDEFGNASDFLSFIPIRSHTTNTLRSFLWRAFCHPCFVEPSRSFPALLGRKSFAVVQ
jgi:hypothetical protein